MLPLNCVNIIVNEWLSVSVNKHDEHVHLVTYHLPLESMQGNNIMLVIILMAYVCTNNSIHMCVATFVWCIK